MGGGGEKSQIQRESGHHTISRDDIYYIYIYIYYIYIYISFLFTSFTLFSIIVFHAPTTQLEAAKNLKLSIKT